MTGGTASAAAGAGPGPEIPAQQIIKSRPMGPVTGNTGHVILAGHYYIKLGICPADCSRGIGINSNGNNWLISIVVGIFSACTIQ